MSLNSSLGPLCGRGGKRVIFGGKQANAVSALGLSPSARDELPRDVPLQEHPFAGQDCCYINVRRNIQVFPRDDDDAITGLCLHTETLEISCICNSGNTQGCQRRTEKKRCGCCHSCSVVVPRIYWLTYETALFPRLTAILFSFF